MAIAAGMEHAPPLWVIDDERVNAFVVGMRERDAVGNWSSSGSAR